MYPHQILPKRLVPAGSITYFKLGSEQVELQLEVDQGNSPIFLQLQKVISYSIRCVRRKCIFRHSSLKKAPFGIFDERTISEKWRKDPEQGFLVCINQYICIKILHLTRGDKYLNTENVPKPLLFLRWRSLSNLVFRFSYGWRSSCSKHSLKHEIRWEASRHFKSLIQSTTNIYSFEWQVLSFRLSQGSVSFKKSMTEYIHSSRIQVKMLTLGGRGNWKY